MGLKVGSSDHVAILFPFGTRAARTTSTNFIASTVQITSRQLGGWKMLTVDKKRPNWIRRPSLLQYLLGPLPP